MNRDGHQDLLVVAEGACSGGNLYQPSVVKLYVGSGTGFSSVPAWSVSESQCESVGDVVVSGGGDFNGDRYDDVVIGFPYDSHYLNQAGRVAVYDGTGTGLSASPSWSRYGSVAKSHLGKAVLVVGDVNADGFDDLLVSAPSTLQPAKVYLFLGSETGLPADPAWTATSPTLSSDGLGGALAGGGDVDGDGYLDVVVGEPIWTGGAAFEGRAHVYLGTSGGVQAQPIWVGHGPTMYGSAVALADVNGDGFADVVVGSYVDPGTNGTYPGTAFLHLGSPSGPSASAAWSPSFVAQERFGAPVTAVGDVNGDGLADIAVGARGYPDGSPTAPGRLLLFLGTRTGLTQQPAWVCAQRPAGGPHFPTALAGLGDTDGDGFDDVLTGSFSAVNDAIGQRAYPTEGACNIHLGGSTDLDGDGMTDDLDPCPELAGGSPEDRDQDRVGDACDNCKLFANWDQRDADADALGDACEFAWGDVAPRGAPDGQITVADVVLILRFSVGLETPTTDELHRANVAPASTVAGPPALVTPTLVPPPGVDVSDAVMALRAAVGLVVFTAPY